VGLLTAVFLSKAAGSPAGFPLLRNLKYYFC